MRNNTKSVVIGTAGHIDHGKTALVRALTGIDTDRLPEEKRRGITIDLGFASVDMQCQDGSEVSLSFVDVPGHRLFIRNMLAGSGGIDCVMLVISAEEGVKPQTEEHLAICTLLGIKQGLTVLTKVDKVTETRLAELRKNVSTFLNRTFLRDAPIITVSAHTGFGLSSLRAELSALAQAIQPRSSASWPRLPIDRAFVLKGFGTIVTGTLQSGFIRRGQELALQPSGRTVRVRGIHIHNCEQEEARAGTRVALNLTGVEVGQIARGHTAVLPSTYLATDVIDVELNLIQSSPALRDRSSVKFHCFSSEAFGKLTLYGLSPLEPGSTALARLKLNTPVVTLPGDCFVLRQSSPALTMGGGRVLDSYPLPRLSRHQRLEWLESFRNASMEQQIFRRIERRQINGISLHALIDESGMRPDEISRALKLSTERQQVTDVTGGHYLVTRELEAAAKLVIQELEGRQEGDVRQGLKRSELRSRINIEDKVFDFLIDRLRQEKKLEIDADVVRPFGVRPIISDAEQRKLAEIAETYRNAGLAPPSPQAVAAALHISDAEMRKLMTILLRDKFLMKIGDLYIQRNVLSDLHGEIRALKGKALDVATFKELTGLTRKYAIPLLEHLDREHITRKQGETRIVN